MSITPIYTPIEVQKFKPIVDPLVVVASQADEVAELKIKVVELEAKLAALEAK